MIHLIGMEGILNTSRLVVKVAMELGRVWKDQ